MHGNLLYHRIGQEYRHLLYQLASFRPHSIPIDHLQALGLNRLHPLQNRNNPTNEDRKSTRLNSSHVSISYAVFCLKKKKKTTERYNIKYITKLIINNNNFM